MAESIELRRIVVRLQANLTRAISAYENGCGSADVVRDLAAALHDVASVEQSEPLCRTMVDCFWVGVNNVRTLKGRAFEAENPYKDETQAIFWNLGAKYGEALEAARRNEAIALELSNKLRSQSLSTPSLKRDEDLIGLE